MIRLLLVLLIASVGRAATYYVATTGNDVNVGSNAFPWLTISHAASTASLPDDIVIFKDGTYGKESQVSPNYTVILSHSGTSGHPITFKAQNRGGAILDCQDTGGGSADGCAAYFNIVSTSFIVFEGFRVTRGRLEGIHSNDSAHDITFRWIEFDSIANHTIVGGPGLDGIYMNSTQSNMLFDGCVFHDIGRVNSTNNDHGIYSSATGLTVINCVFYNLNRGWPIQLANAATNVVIENNTFIGPTTGGGVGQIMLWDSNTNVTIRNNIFHTPDTYALARFTSSLSGTNLFDHNLIYGTSGIAASTTGLTVGSGNQLNVNPLLVSASGTIDAHLQASSPAISAGVDLVATTDYYGIARSSPTDIGAAEYVTSTWTLLSSSSNTCTGTPGAGTFGPMTMANFSCMFAAMACGDTMQMEAGQAINFASGAAPTLAKSCPSGSEVTITTTKTSWLPSAGARILPGHRNNIPYFNATGTFPNISMFNFASRPGDKGVKFVGVGFFLDSTYSVNPVSPYSYIFYLGDVAMTNTDTVANLADNFTFDRALIYSPSYNVQKTVISAILLQTKLFKFINSYVGGMNGTTTTNTGGGTAESKPLLVFPSGIGPFTVTNNVFCCGWTAPFFTGGNNAPFTTGSPLVDGIDFKQNVTINALRFMPGTSTYVGDANRPSIKNGFEIKEGTNVNVMFNTVLNSWANDFSQYYGVKLSIYNQSDTPGCDTAQVASTSVGNTRVTIPGAAGAGIVAGRMIGLPTIASPQCASANGGFVLPQYEYRTVTTVVDAALHVYDVSSAYTGIFGGATTGLKWALVWNPWWYSSKIRVEGNVFRNVAQMVTLEGADSSNCCAPYGTTTDVVVRNNFQLIDSPQANFGAVSIHPAQFFATRGGNRITVEHNTTYVAPSAHASAQTLERLFGISGAAPLTIGNLTIRSNMFAAKNLYGVDAGATLASATDTNFLMTHNWFGGVDYGSVNKTSLTACEGSGRHCLFNYLGYLDIAKVDFRLMNPAVNDFRIRSDRVAISGASNANPITYLTAKHTFLLGQAVRVEGVLGNTAANGSNLNFGTYLTDTSANLFDPDLNNTVGNGAYTGGGHLMNAPWKGGHDGQDVGADMSQVALIRDLRVTPATQWVTFSWTLPSALSNAVCQIEVSPDSGLLNDDGDYTVVNAIRPDYYIRSDQDNVNARATVDATGTRRTFQVGATGSVTGDDGVSHALPLTTGTTYYHRLFCGGAMERGSFSTL